MNTSYWKCLVFTCKSIIWMIADFDNNMAWERETEMQVISNPSISITFQFVCFKIIKQQALSFISKSFFLLNKYMYQLSSDCKRKSIFFCLFLSHFKWSTSIQSLNFFWLQKTYGTLFLQQVISLTTSSFYICFP